MRRFIHPNRAEQRDQDRSKRAAQGEGQCVAAEAAPSRWCVTIALARNRAHSLDSIAPSAPSKILSHGCSETGVVLLFCRCVVSNMNPRVRVVRFLKVLRHKIAPKTLR
jgi:hypothetical protein